MSVHVSAESVLMQAVTLGTVRFESALK